MSLSRQPAFFERSAVAPYLLAALMAIGILASLLWSGFRRSQEADAAVAHTYQVLNASGSLGLYLERAQSSERGYLLTGEDPYVEAYQSWVASARKASATLRRLTADNRVQQGRLDEFDRLLEARLAILSRAVETRQREGAGAVAGLIRNNRGGALMDQLRSVLDAVNEEEYKLLQSRNRAAGDADLRTRWILGLGTGLLVILLVLAVASVEHRTRERNLALRVLERQSRLIDLSHDAIITTDTRRVITGWNSGAEAMYGWTSEQAVGRQLHEFLHTSAPIAIGEIDRAIEQEARWTGELIHTRSDGRRIVVESCQVLQHSAGGLVGGYLEINRDITDRKRAEEARAESLDRLNRVLEVETVGVMFWDLNTGCMIDANETFLKLMGYSRSQVEARELNWQTLTPPEYLDVSRAEVEKFLATGRVGPYEKEYFRKDGTRQWLLFAGSSLGGNQCVEFCVDISARKKAEVALSESESQFRTLANAIPQLCWMANADGWIFWYNERWYEYTGTTAEQMEGWGWKVVHDSQTLPSVLERWTHCVSTGEPFDMVFPLRGADGVFRPFLTRVVPVRGGDGKVARWFGTNTDISAQKQAEAEVKQTRNLLELFIKSAPVALAMFDRDMRYIRASDRWLKDTGLGGQPVIGRSHYELFPGLPEHWKAVHQRGLAGESSKAEEDWVALDGQRHTIRWEVHPWGDSGIGTGGIILGFEDITERKRAEVALRESEQRVRRKLESILSPEEEIGELAFEDVIDAAELQSILEDLSALTNLPMGVVDARGKIVIQAGWQEACTRFHRVHPESLRYCLESDVEASAASAAGDYRSHKCQNNLWVASTPFVMAGRQLGSLIISQFVFDDEPLDEAVFASQAKLYGFEQEDYLATLRSLPRPNRGHIARAMVFFRKFGELVGRLSYANVKLAKSLAQLQRSQETVRQLNAGLEQRVRERTAQLEASNQELEAFAYSVSHDLRAPLRGIDGFSLALAEDYGGQLDEKAHRYLQRVRSETQRMGLLIDDLLQLSRITRAEMRHKPVDLTAIAHTVAARLIEAHAGRHIEFDIEPAMETFGDAQLLEIALTNLLGNSVKFTRKRAQAQIAMGRGGRQDGNSCFFIRDNGVGFDMAHANNLFGAFQRLHKASEFPGTGIGLATVQRIVRRHGGRIWAESKPDQGATFYLTLEEAR